MAGSLSSAWTCQQCKKSQRGAKHRTTTGRTICGPCQRSGDAAAAGIITTGSIQEAIPQSVAIDGARGWLRRALGRRD